MKHALTTLLPLLLLSCAPPAAPIASTPDAPVTAVEVLQGVETLAASREVVAQVARWTRLPSTWLDSPAACAVGELLRQGAAAALPSLREPNPVPMVLGGEIDLSACGLRPVDVDPGALLVLSGTLDQVQGSLLLAGVPRHDPVGYGVACGVLEVLREAGPRALARAITEGPTSLRWSTQPLTAEGCEASVVQRALAAATQGAP